MMWLLPLFTWRVKLGIVVAIVAGAAWFLQHEKTKAFEAGVKSGRDSGWAEAVKTNQAAWDAEAARLSKDAEALNEVSKQLDIQRAELNRQRSSINASLNQALSVITARNVENRQSAVTIQPSQIVPAIRVVLEELRKVEVERNQRPFGPVATR